MAQVTFDDPDERPVDRLAAEYLERVAREGRIDPEEYARQLATEGERAEFLQLVADAARASQLLPRALTVGAILAERYRLDGELGTGGMGKVFSAWDAKLERAVAVKVMHALGAGEASRAELFQRESRLLAALQHPGIVAVHEIADDAAHGVHYIVMDRIDGLPVDRFLERVRARRAAGTVLGAALFEDALERPTPAGRPSLLHGGWWECVARVGAEIARTLEAAHERGVVHRDLKPSNVLLCGGGHPVLLDFGLAALRGAGPASEGATFCGSLPYLAPEQARTFESGDDPRSDVFQVGLVLYELVTLHRAYDGAEVDALLEQVRRGAVRPAREHDSALPVELAAIVHGALAEDLKLRYASARALREDLELYLAGLPPKALTRHRWRRLWKRTLHATRRRPLVAATLVTLLLGSASYGTWYAVQAARWKPPAPQFVRVHDWRFEPLSSGGGVMPEDLIGARLESDRPLVVYALESWTIGKVEFVRPTLPSAVDASDSKRSVRGDEASGALRLPPGDHVVLLQSIDLESPHDVGCRMLIARAELPMLEVWLANLRGAIAAGEDGVPWDDAQRTLANSVDFVARGGPERAFDDPVMRKSLAAAVTTWSDSERATGRNPDLEMYRVSVVVGR
ncbi:MAG: serine/threonine protein kinase [Planctomycetes bacterium]|nr:serine/threonine protein kinase [Planctomycetota bacterium]